MRSRIVRVIAVIGAVAAGSTCSDTDSPSGPSQSTAQWIFRIGSTCAGRLNSAVSIYVDDSYKGQTTGELSVGVNVGRHTYQAFTTNRAWQWGPTEINVTGNGTTTLDCG